MIWKLSIACAMAAAGAALFVWFGLYDVSASTPHLQPTFNLMEATMERSVRRRAADIEPPALGDEGQLHAGAGCFRDLCVQCHGAPGVAQGPIGRSLQPLPGPLIDAVQRYEARELYWITRHGIKMTGMPAWGAHLGEDELWAVVAFMQKLPSLTPAQYALEAATAPSCRRRAHTETAAHAPDPQRGRAILHLHACTACHTIPGTTGSVVHVGPPLAGIGGRQLIAGTLANTPDNMVRWITDPQGVDPATAMPDLDVPAQDARDIAAYLATLR